jgi:hypothetical protein
MALGRSGDAGVQGSEPDVQSHRDRVEQNRFPERRRLSEGGAGDRVGRGSPDVGELERDSGCRRGAGETDDDEHRDQDELGRGGDSNIVDAIDPAAHHFLPLLKRQVPGIAARALVAARATTYLVLVIMNAGDWRGARTASPASAIGVVNQGARKLSEDPEQGHPASLNAGHLQTRRTPSAVDVRTASVMPRPRRNNRSSPDSVTAPVFMQPVVGAAVRPWPSGL